MLSSDDLSQTSDVVNFEYIDEVLFLADGNNAEPEYLEDQQRL